MSLKSQINLDKLPHHIAVIMDGNGRWAQSQDRPRVFGHKNGVEAVRQLTEAAAEIGVDYLTLYAFSKENWKRPEEEVDVLMNLFVQTVSEELPTLNKNNIRLSAIGDLERLPKATYEALQQGISSTKNNDRLDLVLALNYSARWEITHAVSQIAQQVSDGTLQAADVTEDLIASHLSTANIPDPELLIRTSGERRISNFLLWQLSYAELYFTEVYWPDFTKEDLYKAILSFQHRERRFGMTGDQLTNS